MILLEPEYPGSPEALYVLRVALAENDPTADTRCEKVEAWNRDADPEWAKYQPLRWALSRQVVSSSLDGWRKLEAHPIFRIRAGFELQNYHTPTPTRTRRDEPSQTSPIHEVAIA
jgi:hypothetical protein